MKTTVYSLILGISLFTTATQAEVIEIGNFHEVDQSSSIYRGREPKSKTHQLAELGITDVVIFKNDTRGEVVKELNELMQLDITAHHIPFRWKELSSVEHACEHVIEALTIMRDVREAGGSVFIHCTAGEDRTGLLAGVFRMLDEGLSMKETFATEMCAKGYSDGNFHKPWVVTGAIQKELTPLFVALAKKVENHELSLENLDSRICKNLKTFPTKLSCKNQL